MNPVEETQWLYGDEPTDEQYEQPAPVPEGIEVAAKHHRWAQAQAARIKQINALFDAEIALLNARRAEVLAAPTKRLKWNEECVEGWHRAAVAKGLATSTVKFPAGGASKHTNAGTAEVEVTDEQALRDFLLFRDGAVHKKVFRPREGDDFMVSELTKALKFDKDSVEVGAVIPAKLGDDEVEGVRLTRKPATWKAVYDV